MYELKFHNIGGYGCPVLVEQLDQCGNFCVPRGIHTKGKFIDDVGFVSPMVGDVKMSVRETDYEGWLVCDGRSVLQADYPELYTLITNKFGSAISGYFKLPDARGRVLGSAQQSTGTSYRCVGDSVGAETHTLTVPEMPSHTHSSNSNAPLIGLVQRTGFNTATEFDNSSGELDLRDAANLVINSTGGGNAHNNMQPTLFIGNTFIYSGVADSRKSPFDCTMMPAVVQPCDD
jgi:microcystin-dependent protein